MKELLSTWRHTAQRVRGLHERLFYSPLLDTVAKIPSAELRLTTDAAVDRLRALGCGSDGCAVRHIAALSQGVTDRLRFSASCCRRCSAGSRRRRPDHGLLAFRQVSEALGTTLVPTGTSRRAR